jgi:hypothetical protein
MPTAKQAAASRAKFFFPLGWVSKILRSTSVAPGHALRGPATRGRAPATPTIHTQLREIGFVPSKSQNPTAASQPACRTTHLGKPPKTCPHTLRSLPNSDGSNLMKLSKRFSGDNRPTSAAEPSAGHGPQEQGTGSPRGSRLLRPKLRVEPGEPSKSV